MSASRFLEAQNKLINGKSTYKLAFEEITNHKKLNHWIWYVFPQLTGLGTSEYSKYYGINSLHEAESYMCDYVLLARYYRVCHALNEYENIDEIIRVFGALDAKKIHSSLTLFYLATHESFIKDLIDKFFEGHLDIDTLKLLEKK